VTGKSVKDEIESGMRMRELGERRSDVGANHPGLSSRGLIDKQLELTEGQQGTDLYLLGASFFKLKISLRVMRSRADVI